MQIFLNDDVAASCEVAIFIANKRRSGQIEASRIRRAVDKAEKISRIEIAKARNLIDHRDAVAETVEQKSLKFKAEIRTLGADMEEKIAGCRRRRMDRALYRRKDLELLRPLLEVEAIPEIATDSNDARQARGKIAEAHSLDEIIKPIER